MRVRAVSGHTHRIGEKEAINYTSPPAYPRDLRSRCEPIRACLEHFQGAPASSNVDQESRKMGRKPHTQRALRQRSRRKPRDAPL